MTMHVPNRNKLRAADRMRLLIPLLRGPVDGKWLSSDGRAFGSKSDLVAHVAATTGVSVPSLWRWQRAYLADSISGLSQKPRRDTGESRFFSANPEQGLFIAMKCAEGVTRPGKLLAALRKHFGQPLPSIGTIKSFILNQTRKARGRMK